MQVIYSWAKKRHKKKYPDSECFANAIWCAPRHHTGYLHTRMCVCVCVSMCVYVCACVCVCMCVCAPSRRGRGKVVGGIGGGRREGGEEERGRRGGEG